MNLRKDHYRKERRVRRLFYPGLGARRAGAPPSFQSRVVGLAEGRALRSRARKGRAPRSRAPSLPTATRLRVLSAGCDRPRREGSGRNHKLRPRRPARVASRVSTTRRVPPERGGGLNVPGAGLGPRSRGARRSLPLVKNPFKYLMNALALAIEPKSTTLSGGSLGSCVDEERS